ncbi:MULTISPECIES: hypothetical protein [unclassified Gilliamella]|uniref:hypothetical protein n=1 Tax=unclassified Gilliamella TaxID=2685620 RepID=UPI00132B79F4|nr:MULTISPECIES: hypothetical protein [unclassified Gilliamella]MWN31111.1 hypothetical protein [Gilliamella sp. Pra-s60]MWP28324.1 hypothetical protein [Gilliamella sp. Pra-s54]
MKKIKHSLLLVCSITLVGCFGSGTTSSSSVERMIDNPTPNEIKVIIDGNELTIPAKSSVNYTFEYGKHTLSYGNQSLNFIAKPSITYNSGLINPTQSNYYLFTTFYTTLNVSDETYDKLIAKYLKLVPVIINGEEQALELPVKVINDVFIERQKDFWDYSVDEPYPAQVTLRGKGQFQSQKIKLFREDSFIEALKAEGLNEKVDFINEHPKFSELKKYTIPNIQLDAIACKKGREFVETQLNDWNKLFTLTGKDLALLYKQLTSSETSHTEYDIMTECKREVDPNQSYQFATRELDGAFYETKQLNFFITQ